MKKLIHGILEFQKKNLPAYREKFASLAEGQSPDALLIACSDSRVVPNLFASTDPGDLFVVRNVGNLVPTWRDLQKAPKGSSVGAALEFAVNALQVKDIIICGHSNCGAMRALLEGGDLSANPQLFSWLELAKPSLEALKKHSSPNDHLSPVNQLSQLNTLRQVEALREFPYIRERCDQGLLALHAWYFDISQGQVYAYFPEEKQFLVIDDQQAERLL